MRGVKDEEIGYWQARQVFGISGELVDLAAGFSYFACVSEWKT